ncbi:TonB-dependent siderophore receptor [Steroidobacter sp.]|uniref:TonB-dependent siderophore receptor n=1 Tax=Steroidobacter sp. TaxID=1978227 RepID=UPI001A4BA525|nr:TonB-dependent receptor [Steroidobacter sp.]MBL8271771.1 TonB-dependent siderophore receptor [Steroidobacter sp.]
MKTSVKRWTRSALLSLACSVLLAGHADADGAKRQLTIPAGDLTVALDALASQSGAEFVYSAEKLKGLRTEGVSGELSVEDAVNKLLQGTRLELRKTHQSGAFLIAERESQDTASIETVNVFGTLDDELSIGSKAGQSLRETPKSVTVVTRERIEEQNLTSLVDALNQTTGVTLTPYSPVDVFFFSRGFRVQTIQIDGGAPAYTGGFGSFLTPDMAVYDHVEMLRGVDGMYTGAGEPGGVINLVRKRALSTPTVNVNVSAGRWNFGRTELDLTGPITSDGRLRGRIVGAYENKDYFYDRAESEKTIFFGTVEYDLTPSTLVAVGANYERRKEDGYFIQGFPRYLDGRDLKLPRSKSLAPDWSLWHFTTKEAFARVEQDYGTGKLKLNVTRIEQESANQQFISYGAVDPVTLTGPVSYGRSSSFDSTQNLIDLSATGGFELFGRQHNYTIGADYSAIDGGGQKGYSMTGYDYPGPAIDVFAPFDPAQFPEPDLVLNSYYPENGQKQHGYYATLGVQLAEPLRLTLGGRYGQYEYEQIYQPVSAGVYGAPSRTFFKDSKFIPSAALSWNFAADWTAYASYAETFRVQANMLQAPLPGTPLDPVTGDGYEFGVKGEIGKFNAAFAVYRVERNGQGVADPAYPFTPGSDGSNCCYLRQANVTSEGFDAEVSGTITRGLQLFAGYTYNTSKFEGDQSGFYDAGAYFLSVTPKHMAKVWSTWNLPFGDARWTINSGVVAQTDSYIEGVALSGGQFVPFRTTQGTYAVWNASVQYKLSDTWSVGVYGDNLLDRRYYSVLGSIDTENSYGTPRSYVVTLRGRW